MQLPGNYWEPPFSWAQGACGKSRATECDEISSRRALGLRRATGPAERDLVGSVGLFARYVFGPQQWSTMMKTLTLLALPLAICLSSPGVAQQAGINAGPEAGAPASRGLLQNGADAEIGAQSTWQELLSRVASSPANANSVGGLNVLVGEINAGSNIQLIEVFSLKGAPAGEDRGRALQTALTASANMRTAFLNAVSANPAVMNKLSASGHAVSDVVGITKNRDGTFLIYVVPPKAGEALPGAFRTKAPAQPDSGPAGGVIAPRLGDTAG